MNLYLTSQQSFLEALADFILNNFAGKLHNLKIILPTNFSCRDLQHILIGRLGTTILPDIMPVMAIDTENEEIFKIPSSSIESISRLEEKIILAEIINNYGVLSHNILHSLEFSPRLARLFNNFKRNNINLSLLDDLTIFDNAEHWQYISKFLKHAFEEWGLKAKEKNKILYEDYLKLIFELEIGRIKNFPENHIIIAGVIGNDPLIWNFIKEIVHCKNGHLILPPLPANIMSYDFAKEAISYENILCCLHQLLKTLGNELKDFKYLSDNKEQFVSCFDNLILNNYKHKLSAPNVEYTEFQDIYAESENIAKICLNNPNKKIAIILANSKTKEFYTNVLKLKSIKFQDLLGRNLSSSLPANLIIHVSEMLCLNFSLKNLFICLKTTKAHQNLISELERLLEGKNRFISSWQQVIELIDKNISISSELREYCLNLKKIFYYPTLPKDFSNLLRICIHIAEEICATIWDENGSYETAEFYVELLGLDLNFKVSGSEQFPDLLKTLIAGGRYFPKDQAKINITFCQPQDAALSKFDIVVIPDFNEAVWPPTKYHNPWFNRQMQEQLNLFDEEIKYANILYNFYLLLYNPKVVITRAKKQGSNADVLESPFFRKLKLIAKIKIIQATTISPTNYNNKNHVPCAKSNSFPSKLSATDIEILMRNPYSFYAKKILNLRKKENIATPPQMSEFGSFVHDIIDQYTKAYTSQICDKLGHIISICQKTLDKTNIFEITKKIWLTKFSAIAEEFIIFDEARRSNAVKIYSELKGNLHLDIMGEKIEITAIADRIEIDHDNRAYIIDYKTGSAATEKDVMEGLSPQLVIGALIAVNGGFGFEVKDVAELIYVKIASSSPYIQTITIHTDLKNLDDHKNGLINVLEYYVKNKIFSLERNLLKYNDYQHLARIVKF